MERRRFVLSWGRKIFFGLAWPLFCLLGIIFLKSGVIPKDVSSLVYYVATSVGFFGLLTTVLYFVLYVPLALMFPTYYFVRLWSAFLILITSAALLIDGVIFSEYRFHINKVILMIASMKGPAEVFNGSVSPLVAIAGAIVFLFFVLWIRGEWLWRVMQRRFSNPVKNWYFGLIILSLAVSHLIWSSQRTSFFGNDVTVASLFPVNYQEIFFPKTSRNSAMATMHVSYPKKDLKCGTKSPSDLIVVVLNNVSNSASPESTPFLAHLQQHGNNFRSHVSGGGSVDDNLYRLVFSLPVSYRPGVTTPVLFTELQKAGYDVSVFSERRIPGLPEQKKNWSEWLTASQASYPAVPNFLFFDVTAPNAEETDLKLKEIFSQIEHAKLLSGSTILITGTAATEWEMVPMTLILPDRSKSENTHRTTHYDVVPSIMKRVLNCKTSPSSYSIGKDLAEAPTKDWEVFGDETNLRIADYAQRSIVETDGRGSVSPSDTGSASLVLKVSKEISRFYR